MEVTHAGSNPATGTRRKPKQKQQLSERLIHMGASKNTKTKETPNRKDTPLSTKEKSNHPLSALIPEKDIFGSDNYISRNFNGISEMEILEQAYQERHNVLIYGPTGPGKTSAVYAFAADKGLPVVNVSCNGAAEPSYFIGGWQPQSDGSLDYVAGDVLLAVQHGGIIYLDEVNFLPPKIASYLHPLTDKRRTISIPSAQGSSIPSLIKAHPNCFIIGAYNPDYEGTRPLNQAFKNRFKYKMHFDYDATIESQLLNSASLLELAVKLRDRFAVGDISTPISTNLLIEFEEINESALGFDYAIQNFLASFNDDERAVVQEVFLIYAKNIWADLNTGNFEEESIFAPAFKEAKPKEQVDTSI